MPTEIIRKGPAFEIRGWVNGGECQVVNFLEELSLEPKSDYDRLDYLLTRTADVGVLKNAQQIRPLGDGFFEFKGTRTSRIVFFYDEKKIIICSQGFSGERGSEKRDVQQQIAKASKIREAYLKEKGEKNG